MMINLVYFQSIQFFLLIAIKFILATNDSDTILVPWDSRPSTIIQLQQEYLKKYINPEADKCEDFNEYSCGFWGKYHKKPGEQAYYNAIYKLIEDITKVVHKELENSRYFQHFNKEHPIRMAKEYYDSCMDIRKIKSRGYTPLIDFIKTKFKEFSIKSSQNDDDKGGGDWIKLLTQLRMFGGDSIMNIIIESDITNTSYNTIYIDQPSTETEISQSTKAIIELVQLFGISKEIGEEIVKEVTEFESGFYEFVTNIPDRPRISELFSKITLDDLQMELQGIDWIHLIKTLRNMPNLNTAYETIMIDRKYLAQLAPYMAKKKSRIINNYLLIRFAISISDHVKTKDDSISPKELWNTCTLETMHNMDMAVANLFIKKFMRSRKKSDIDLLTRNLKSKYSEIFQQSNWMDPKTKENAIKKLDRMYFEIGFPLFINRRFKLKKWFAGIKIDHDKYFETTMNLIELRTKRDLETIGVYGAYDPYESQMTDANAHYDIFRNKITIMSGLLQIPYYHPTYPHYMKYGVVGSIIGHEMTHGFDNYGRHHDEYGNVRNWWSEDASKEYEKRSLCLIEQYEEYDVANANFTLTEIIADNNGVKLAYLAYKDWLTSKPIHRPFGKKKHKNGGNSLKISPLKDNLSDRNYIVMKRFNHNGESEMSPRRRDRPRPIKQTKPIGIFQHNKSKPWQQRRKRLQEIVPGLDLTGEQLFFVAYTQWRCDNGVAKIFWDDNDPHPPENTRVKGSLSNLENFGDDFKCKFGAEYNPKKKCVLW